MCVTHVSVHLFTPDGHSHFCVDMFLSMAVLSNNRCHVIIQMKTRFLHMDYDLVFFELWVNGKLYYNITSPFERRLKWIILITMTHFVTKMWKQL